MGWFIHLDDPGFQDNPFPGQRRLGPFDTAEEAVAQAVSDAAVGMGVAAGVYGEDESAAQETGGKGKAHMARSELRRRGEVEARRRAKIAAHFMLSEQERDRALDALLPEGIRAADLREQGVIR